MDKVQVTLFLRDSGVPLADAHEAIEGLLRDERISVHLPEGSDATPVRQELDRLGVIV